MPFTPPQLAMAGFYNCPLPDAPDTCACIYCDVQLDGWSKNDDPECVHCPGRCGVRHAFL